LYLTECTLYIVSPVIALRLIFFQADTLERSSWIHFLKIVVFDPLEKKKKTVA